VPNFIVFVAEHAFIFFLLVQLVPGTEVAVAPKKRKERSSLDVQKQTSLKEQVKTKAHLCVLSYAVLIHPETAANITFDNTSFFY
jgi:peroxin-1